MIQENSTSENDNKLPFMTNSYFSGNFVESHLMDVV